MAHIVSRMSAGQAADSDIKMAAASLTDEYSVGRRGQMAKNASSTTSSSQADLVNITFGRASVSVPADHIDAVISLLQAAKQLRVGKGGRVAAAALPAQAPRRRGRPPKNPQLGAIPRSRKRVGDALKEWMGDNPGWHSTDSLISLVREHRMTDASPVRAVMIALGKQRGDVFETDGTNLWRLVGDTSGPPPQSEPKVRKKPGRKPGTGKKAVAAPAPRGKRAPAPKRRGRTSKKSDKESSQRRSADVDSTAARTVRVKRGQTRKAALLTAAEVEARTTAAKNVDRMRDRWSTVSRAERERARKNLFGADAPAKSR